MHRHTEHCRTLQPSTDDAEVEEVLAHVRRALREGLSVTVSLHEASMTTQEAADVLGVSRPTLVRLLEDGAIPYEQPGRHRRVQLDDVLAFQDAHRHSGEADERSAT